MATLPRRVVRLLWPHRVVLGVAVLLIAGQVALGTVSPLLLQRIIDDALPGRRTGYLTVLCVLMFGCALVGSVLALTLSRAVNKVGQNVVHRLRMLVYGQVQKQPLSFFTGRSIAEVEARVVSDVGGISSALTLTAQSVLAAVIQLAAALVAMFYLNWMLATASLAISVVLAVLVERAGRRRRRLARDLQKSTARMMQAMVEDLSISGIVLGRTARRFDTQRERFAGASRQVAELTARQRVAGAGVRLGIGTTFAAVPPVLYFLAGTGSGGISLGTVVALSTLQARLAGPIQQLLGIGATMHSTAAMFERTFEYIDLDPEFTLSEPASQVPDLPTTIGFGVRELTYRYSPAGPHAVTGVDLSFPAHSLTVLTGATGSGKSTLSLLLAGQVRPTGGQVLLDGDPVDPEALWRRVTLVPQETVLFNASLRENLLFARPDATDAELIDVLMRVRLDHLLDVLPGGLDAPVGERGYGLSGGERQRVGLGRALLGGTGILVADESTSAVDNETADVLFEVLRRETARRTVVFIAHRLPRLTGDDRVVVMSEGRVLQAGRHGELSARPGAYRQLLELQARPPAGPVGVPC